MSDMIFPILETLTNSSNSSLVYNAARSIWADLTAANEYVVGPFRFGMHCLDDLEDDYMQANNLTESSPAMQNMFLVDAIIIGAYQEAWGRAYAAVNESGLLGQLTTLGSYLMTNETNVKPAAFSQVAQSDPDDAFFSNYNKTVPGYRR